MLLDLWEWFLLISDGIDLVISNLASGTYPIPLSFLLLTSFFAFISFFAWRSTDIPELPPAPRPPYVIQITAGPSGSGGSRQTINDVRLLSGGVFFDRSEILSGYPNISRNQATNTDRPGASPTGILRNARGQIDVNVNGPAVRRRSIGRSFLLGLFRRPIFPRPVPVPAVNAIRAQLNSPNVVVYHRVNVYHHHIHSHVGPSSSNPAAVNRDNDPSQNPQEASSASSSTSNPEDPNQQSSSQTPNSTETTTTTSTPTPAPAAGPSESIPVVVTSSIVTPETSRLEGHHHQDPGSNGSSPPPGGDVVGTTVVDGLIFSTTSTGTPTVQIEEAVNVNEPGPDSDMPARSSGNQSTGGGGGSSRVSSTFPQRQDGDGTDDVKFTIKFLNDTQMDVTSQLGEKIVDFKRRHFATEMSENKTVRLIFNGRVLDNDNKTLREFGIFDQCVVHCLIVNRQQSQDQSRTNSGSHGGGVPGGAGIAGGGARGNNGDPQGGGAGNMRRVVGLPEPGMFFVAFIGIFLVFLWFICLHFGQHLFTQSAVVSLTVLTAIFLIGIVACYLPLPAN